MFNRTRAYEMRAWYRSRYNEMISSIMPEDISNAEACRLASQCWEDLARNMQVPDAEVEYEPEEAIQEMIMRWEDYCLTGVVRNDVDELAKDLRDNFHAEIEARRKVAMERSQAAGQPVPEAASDSQTSQKGKKRQKPESSAESSGVASKPTEEVRIDQATIDLIRPRVMDDIVNEIRNELSLDPVTMAST